MWSEFWRLGSGILSDVIYKAWTMLFFTPFWFMSDLCRNAKPHNWNIIPPIRVFNAFCQIISQQKCNYSGHILINSAAGLKIFIYFFYKFQFCELTIAQKSYKYMGCKVDGCMICLIMANHVSINLFILPSPHPGPPSIRALTLSWAPRLLKA